MKKIAFFFLIALSFHQTYAYPETLTIDGKIPYRVPKIEAEITIDGHLNEAIWDQAVKINANIEVRPGENIEAPVRTEVLLAHDDEKMYVAFLAYDPDPSKIRAHFCDRDNIGEDDWVLILFDTFNDQRRTFDFGCNPFGIQMDFMETPAGGGDAWDAIWESDGRITDDGYIVEMAIPFNSLGFPRMKGEQIWGFDAVRSYPRDVRHHIGAFPRDRNNNCYMCQAEKLIGFADMTPGRNVEFDPTLSAIVSQEREDWTSGPFVDKERKIDPGLTARWGFTPNLMLSTAVNPDFSNIEADILQLDINNQFAIYYPEKRPFFLEGNDLFQTPFIQMVHTRALADPDWGVKITGKEGANAIGLSVARDHITNYLFPGVEGSDSESSSRKSYGSVLRYRRDIFKSSTIGLILTDREGDDYYNRMAGFDGDIKFTPRDLLQFQVFGSRTRYPMTIAADYDQPSSGLEGYYYNVYFTHDTRSYEFYGLHRVVDRNFRADLGFLTQVGYQYNEISGMVKWRRDSNHWYNWLSIYSSFDEQREQGGRLLHRANTCRINYEGPLQSHAHWLGSTGKDRYNGQEFRLNWMQGCFGLRPTPPLFVHVYWRYGDQIDYANTRLGTRFFVEPYFELNLGLHVKVALQHDYERLDVNAGRLYTANMTYLRLTYQLSKRIFLRTILQYKDYRRNASLYIDDVESRDNQLFSQYLFSYKINPHTVFFLGYSDDYYGDQQTNFLQTNRTVFAKVGYAYNL